MIRKYVAIAALTTASLTGFAGVATAQNASKPNPLKCVGAADHAKAQGFRLQALDAELAALNARLSAATQAGKTEAVARITARIAKVKARMVTVQANQAKLAAKCPVV